MFDIGYSELLLIAIVTLLVVGPKELPRLLRTVGHWMGRGRAMARHFRAGFDTMVREAELDEMNKRWAEQNAAIMAASGADLPPTDPEADADRAEVIPDMAPPVDPYGSGTIHPPHRRPDEGQDRSDVARDVLGGPDSRQDGEDSSAVSVRPDFRRDDGDGVAVPRPAP